MITYKWVPWRFDNSLWSAAVKGGIERVGLSDLAGMCDLDESTLKNWAAGRYTREFKWPHMLNFLKVCNALDMNPRSFFTVEDE